MASKITIFCFVGIILTDIRAQNEALNNNSTGLVASNLTLGNYTATEMIATETDDGYEIKAGRCHLGMDCFDVDFEEKLPKEDIGCCDSSGNELILNASYQLGFCCSNGTLLVPGNKRKCMTVAILAVSLISSLIVIVYIVFNRKIENPPKDSKNPFGNLSFAHEKSPPKKTISLPVEKPYLSCPLFDESANESSEEEKMSSLLKKSTSESQNQLVFEMVQEDFEENMNEDEALLTFDSRNNSSNAQRNRNSVPNLSSAMNDLFLANDETDAKVDKRMDV